MPDVNFIKIPDKLVFEVCELEEEAEVAATLLLDWWNRVAAPADRKGADHFEIFKRTESGSWRLITLSDRERQEDDFIAAKSAAIWEDYIIEFRKDVYPGLVSEGPSRVISQDMSGKQIAFHDGGSLASRGWSEEFAQVFARHVDDWIDEHI